MGNGFDYGLWCRRVGDRDNTQGGNSGKLSGAIMWQKTINGKNLKALEESRLVDFGY